MEVGMEKRKEKRIKKRLLANVDLHSAITCDISANGLRITTGTKPKTVLVDVKLDLEHQKFNLKGKVKWIKRDPIKRQNTIGISIHNVPKEYHSKAVELFPMLAVDKETQIEIEEIKAIFGD